MHAKHRSDEFIIVLALALVILRPQRLPEAGRSLGRGMREFKQSLTSGDEDQRAAAAELAAERSG